jgi:hypothetical protein
MFTYLNDVIAQSGIEIKLGNDELAFLRITVLFSSDLAMLPLIFGVNHFASLNFCPICLVNRHDHRVEATVGPMRNLDKHIGDKIPLLKIPVDNIVPPPLHMIQGALNKMLELMDINE